jgi:hypothetical protein
MRVMESVFSQTTAWSGSETILISVAAMVRSYRVPTRPAVM